MAVNNMDLIGASAEETLLLNMGHELMNFRPGFPKSSLKHTYVLSHYGSGMFGLMPMNDQLYLGIPKRFYDKFKTAKWLYVARVKGQAGLYLVMHLGTGNKAHPVGLRIFVRSRRLVALDGSVKSMRAVPMDNTGITRENDLLQGFTLKLLQLDAFDWEQDQ
jgi:hypothetical protein